LRNGERSGGDGYIRAWVRLSRDGHIVFSINKKNIVGISYFELDIVARGSGHVCKELDKISAGTQDNWFVGRIEKDRAAIVQNGSGCADLYSIDK
jgi:hypothetical protein